MGNLAAYTGKRLIRQNKSSAPTTTPEISEPLGWAAMEVMAVRPLTVRTRMDSSFGQDTETGSISQGRDRVVYDGLRKATRRLSRVCIPAAGHPCLHPWTSETQRQGPCPAKTSSAAKPPRPREYWHSAGTRSRGQ